MFFVLSYGTKYTMRQSWALIQSRVGNSEHFRLCRSYVSHKYSTLPLWVETARDAASEHRCVSVKFYGY